MNKILLISFFLFFNWVYSQAQPADRRITREEYIEKYKDDAIREMMKSGVPASITLAQGILESGDGNSPLAIYAKNHFGVKCHKGWTGESMSLDDDEKNECFRKYESVYESFSDHSDFLVTRSRYDFLFDLKGYTMRFCINCMMLYEIQYMKILDIKYVTSIIRWQSKKTRILQWSKQYLYEKNGNIVR